MQDRLKFRVWCKDYNEWEKDTICISNKDNYILDNLRPRFLRITDIDPINHEISFCTGLKDKNGRLIFEGDILKETCKDDELGETYFDFTVVKWDKVCAGYIMYHPAYTRDTVFFDEAVDDGDNTGILKNFEVVGNIYENPDLLKEKGENNEQGK